MTRGKGEVSMGPIRQVRKVVTVSALLIVLTLSLGGAVASKSNSNPSNWRKSDQGSRMRRRLWSSSAERAGVQKRRVETIFRRLLWSSR